MSLISGSSEELGESRLFDSFLLLLLQCIYEGSKVQTVSSCKLGVLTIS